jgi:hypothetical protein
VRPEKLHMFSGIHLHYEIDMTLLTRWWARTVLR